MAAGVAGLIAVAVILLVIPGVMAGQHGGSAIDTAVTILRPPAMSPKTVPQGELVDHALAAINKDREEFGLPPVKLSDNKAAQVHAEDVFKAKQISHWTTNGEKPYMVYTQQGGKGGVHQNVAIAGFGSDQYDRCKSLLLLCEKIDPVKSIDELEREMMDNDDKCCANGHRDNILDPHHTHVSIGIVYDDYYLALVQNFENDYGLDVSMDGSYVSIVGPVPDGSKLDHVVVYYDEIPTPAAYEANKKMISYSAGELVASAFEPLPIGMRYQQPDGYEVIEADSWIGEKGQLDVGFDLSPAINRDGVYTIYAMFKDEEGRQFDGTSYSAFVTGTGARTGT
ncbi:MAG: CAP domain-containing protein [Nitrososphaera sp.]